MESQGSTTPKNVMHVHARRDAERNKKPTHLKPNRSVHGYYSAASLLRRLRQAEVAKLTQLTW